MMAARDSAREKSDLDQRRAEDGRKAKDKMFVLFTRARAMSTRVTTNVMRRYYVAVTPSRQQRAMLRAARHASSRYAVRPTFLRRVSREEDIRTRVPPRQHNAKMRCYARATYARASYTLRRCGGVMGAAASKILRRLISGAARAAPMMARAFTLAPRKAHHIAAAALRDR